MKVLVIPDIHCRKFWRKVIDENIGKVSKVIFLGDYLDPYPDEIKSNLETMEVEDFYDWNGALNMLDDIFALKINEPEKFILLTGNHTDSYIWSNFSSASRTDYKNWEIYHNVFLDNLDLFNFVYIQDSTIFTHAGISQNWAERVWEFFEFPEDELYSVKEIAQTLMDTPLKNFNRTYINMISWISSYRGGDAPCGSCEWADIREHIDKMWGNGKIRPKGEDGVYQIFGHTQLKKPIITEKWACLDCRKGFIVDTNTHEIEEC